MRRMFACLIVLGLTACASAPTAPPQSYDQSQHVPMAAGVSPVGQVLVLHRIKGHCAEGLRVRYSEQGGQDWMGCWTLDGDEIVMRFEDGDVRRVLADVLMWFDRDGNLVERNKQRRS